MPCMCVISLCVCMDACLGQVVRALTADFPIRMDALTVAPSTLKGSVRGTFLRADELPAIGVIPPPCPVCIR